MKDNIKRKGIVIVCPVCHGECFTQVGDESEWDVCKNCAGTGKIYTYIKADNEEEQV